MNYPTAIAGLIQAQNDLDSNAYAQSFSENAIVHDEGRTHTGRAAIERWIAEANEKYRTKMKALSYTENGKSAILEAEGAGNFPGSPLVFQYHMELQDGLISSLRITA